MRVASYSSLCRYDSRVLLCAYYGLRGVALILLPWAFDLSFAGACAGAAMHPVLETRWRAALPS